MNASDIIDEIKRMPRDEQERVVEFVETLPKRRHWSGEKLTEYSKRMVETDDPVEAERLKQQIVAGFFGDDEGA